MKIIRHFFVFLLMITTYFSLLLLTFIGSTQLMLSKENIIELSTQIEFREFVGFKVEDEIYQLLEQTGLPSSYVDYIIEEKNFKQYIGNYMADSMESLLYRKEHTEIDDKELKNILLSGFDQAIDVLEEQNETNIMSTNDQQRIRQKMEYFVPKIAKKIPKFETVLQNKALEDGNKALKNTQAVIQILQKLYQWKFVLSISILVQLGFIFLLKINKFHYMKWFMMPFLATGGTLFYAKYQLPSLIEHHFPKNLTFMKEAFEYAMNSIYSSWDRTIIICFALCILFIILQILIHLANDLKHRYK